MKTGKKNNVFSKLNMSLYLQQAACIGFLENTLAIIHLNKWED